MIYFYIFICISLLAFNVMYIAGSKGRNRSQEKRTLYWEQLMDSLLNRLEKTNALPEGHGVMLVRRFSDIRELMAFMNAAELRMDHPMMRRYLNLCHDSFQELALIYKTRPAMERAFFAYVIAQCKPGAGREHDLLAELLLEFLEDSTVYCRENVLQAFYALGNAGAVEKALSRFHENGWFHHTNLLSDGLTAFQGDREALAKRLWAASQNWDETLQAAVVRFAANVTDAMQEPFLEALADSATPEETKFALVRYFQRRPFEKAYPVLCAMAGSSDNGGPAIAACSALAKYPGEETVAVLSRAVCSRNWYARRNAADSLIRLGVSEQTLGELTENDRYAREMLEYVSGKHFAQEAVL